MAGHGEQVAHGMDPAALPGGALQNATDRGFQAGVGVGDHQPYTAQAAVLEVAQEFGPERLVLGVADVDPEDLAVPIGA